MDTGLQDAHILITGAAGGIGIETVRAFLSEGARVTAVFHHNEGALPTITNDDRLLLVKTDVRHEKEVEAAFRSANETFGRVDVLVSNAGIANMEGVGVHEMTLEQWKKTLEVNLTGAFLCSKYFFKNLQEFPGELAALILVGSTAAVFGEAWYSDYATSKAGMHGLMMSLKNEIVYLAHRGRVNIVNPGWTKTPMAEAALEDFDMVRRIHQTIPMKKTATPKDIANAIVFLASDQLAGHISGQSIVVAGGMEGRALYTPHEALSWRDDR
ncbi:MAG: SDR family oxidoreductase [Candidatus Thorarchaeota archaeon]|nr:SDR family oxidoreductase [Candidatus Thorarchaeota archaeon]